jgi:predicted phosphodiesterase
MKILCIGDIHGRDVWNKIVQTESFDHVVFIGDYFDSFNILSFEQVHNFRDIIQFKKDNPNKVTLLVGNHDFHYIPGIPQSYSGYQMNNFDITFEINEAIKQELLQMCYVHDNYIFTHAGLTKTWCKNNDINYDYLKTLESELNIMFQYRPILFGFISGICTGYGDSVEHGPLWVRPKYLEQDAIPGIHIIGHTHNNNVEITNTYVNVDALPYEYLVIDNEELIIKQMK